MPPHLHGGWCHVRVLSDRIQGQNSIQDDQLNWFSLQPIGHYSNLKSEYLHDQFGVWSNEERSNPETVVWLGSVKENILNESQDKVYLDALRYKL